MKRLLLTCAAATAFMLAGCIRVDLATTAASVDGGRVTLTGGDINTTLNASEDARVTGSDLRLRGYVGGELTVAAADFSGRDLDVGALSASAADIDFRGAVRGPADLRAADVRWRGPVGGAFTAASADLDFEGSVVGLFKLRSADMRLSGDFNNLDLRVADAVFTRQTDIAGDVYADAATLRHDGVIRGGLDAQARTVFLNGIVEGPLALEVDPGRGRLDAQDGLVEINGRVAGGVICARRVVISGEVAGAMTITADAAPELDGGRADQISFTPRDGARCRRQ